MCIFIFYSICINNYALYKEIAMAKAKFGMGGITRPTPTKKKTSIGGNNSMTKKSSMNKSKKRGFKAYRGQGR